MTITIEQPGLHTSVQDLGRTGHLASGISVGGAVDAIAARVANLIVGNSAKDALLECAISGPVLRFSAPAIIAICGATVRGIPGWKPVQIKRNEIIDFKQITHGNYAYIAVAGGIDVPMVLDSRSTELRSGFGGFQGRILRIGDRIKIGKSSQTPASLEWSVNGRAVYHIGNTDYIRIVRGSEWNDFDNHQIFQTFKTTSQSNRMGARLRGIPLIRRTQIELQSTPVIPGTIQIPPDGQPIILLADAQTMGGYPKIGHVATVDLPRAAQLRVGAEIQLTEITLQEAHDLAIEQSRQLAFVQHAIAHKMRYP